MLHDSFFHTLLLMAECEPIWSKIATTHHFWYVLLGRALSVLIVFYPYYLCVTPGVWCVLNMCQKSLTSKWRLHICEIVTHWYRDKTLAVGHTRWSLTLPISCQKRYWDQLTWCLWLCRTVRVTLLAVTVRTVSQVTTASLLLDHLHTVYHVAVLYRQQTTRQLPCEFFTSQNCV